MADRRLARVRRLRRLPVAVRHRYNVVRHGSGRHSVSVLPGVVERHQPSEVGVDIFDTVLMRRLIGDAAAERAVAHRTIRDGIWPGDVEQFLAARKAAHRADPAAPLRSWLRDPAFSQLRSPERAHELEVEVERELLVAVPGAGPAIERLRDGRRLVYVSDMHLDAATLRDLLVENQVGLPDDEVISSCEHNCSKSSGGLFGVALRSLGQEIGSAPGRTLPWQRARRSRPLFIGNNPWSDVTRAHQAGARPLPAFGANPTEPERLMAARPGTAGPAIAGAARLVRLRHNADPDDGPDGTIRSLGAQTIGQMMAAFLLWVRARCAENGIRHLHFLARDGRLPYRMARAMPADHWSGVDLGYLHCSRRAWLLGAVPAVGIEDWVAVGTADNWAFLTVASTQVPFANLLRRCGLTISDVPSNSPLASADPTEPLDDERAQAWRALLRSGELHELIEKAAVEPTRLITTHLRSSDLPDDAPVALVDVGWRGQQAWLVSALVEAATGHEPLNLHFGGIGVDPTIDAKVRIERFALDDSRRPSPIRSPVACLEMFLGTGEPRLIGYRGGADGQVEPVMEANGTAVDNPTRRSLAAGACELAANLPSLAETRSWGLSQVPLVEETAALLAQIWNTPDPGDAAVFADLLFEHDDAGQVVGPVVSPYSVSEFVGRDDVPRMWREGSLAVTPWWFRTVMSLYFGVRESSRTPDS